MSNNSQDSGVPPTHTVASDVAEHRVISHTGLGYFPIAFVSRLPFAMMVVGVLTLVVAGRGSMQLAGFNSAMVGFGAAIFGPLIGAAADRYGQRNTLLITGAASSAALASFAWVVYSPMPDWVMLLNAFVVGATAPQTSPMSRSRLVTIIIDKFPIALRDRALNRTMAYESTADELVFVFGPFLVGIFAVAFGPSAPIVVASILTIIFVGAFALHRTSVPGKSREERAETLAPASQLARPALLVVVGGIFGVGIFFGSVLTALTAFMQSLGREEEAGLLYGIMGIGSAILALAVAVFPPSFTRRARWLVFALIMLGGTVLLQFVHGQSGIILALAVMGLGIGPTLVTQYSFGADRSPIGRSATVMTMLGSAIIVGQSIASAVTGWLSEELGATAGFVMPLVAASIVTTMGILNWWLTPGGKELSMRTGSIPVQTD